jgi:hypothetical protein
MNIITTNISDINTNNIDKSKVALSNKIIKNVYPLFDEVYSDKLLKIEELEIKTQDKRNQISEEKNELEIFLKEYSRKKKIKKLLERLSKLISSGLVHDGSLRTETIIILKIINKLPDNKLDEHLHSTMKSITKRFSRA